MTGWNLPAGTWALNLPCARQLVRTALSAFLLFVLPVAAVASARAQTSPQATSQAGPYERTYPQSKSAVEKALKELQASMRGRLPVLEGFAAPADHPLSHYQRAYYEASAQVSSTPSGGTVVRVNTKLTAWYKDSIASRSGYQLLTSNGRLESDLLDQLSDLLGSSGSTTNGATYPQNTTAPVSANASSVTSTNQPPAAQKATSTEAEISAPMPQSPEAGHTFSSSSSSSLQPGLPNQQPPDRKNSKNKAADQTDAELRAVAASLEEVLKNQAHPRNLVAVKKTGTPVVATPSLNAKPLFLATEHDEFEMLDFNADWVHVRISGLSRGWIWRTSLEMPEGLSDVPLASEKAAPVAADLFQITREETGTFPGDWEALRGKSVKIISVQKIREDEKNAGAPAKLEFAKSVLDKSYGELASNSKELAGVVLIFDSVDGGMIAITLPTVEQWKAGKLTDAALWHRCYFDPPETFSVSSSVSRSAANP
ncbi:MAG: hypothetical protein WBF54_14100 [Terriglobales bacterium]